MKPVSHLFTRRTFLGGAASLGGAAAVAACSTRAALATEKASAATIYRRGDPGYEEVRRGLVWQAIKPARYPSRIVEVATAADVADALKDARADKRRVAIVSCGHSYIGAGVRDEAVVLHLAKLQQTTINKAARSATLEPGVRAYQFDALLQKEGLAFPVPHSPTVGLAGFLLGGGMGWNAESWNSFACFNLAAIEAVLTSGETVLADARQHSDLFWAARGGGPYFPAVVTRFHVNVFARPAAIRESTLVYSIDAAPAVIAWMEQAHDLQDPQVELTLIFGTADPADSGGAGEKQCVVSCVCFGDTEVEANRMYQAIARNAPREGLVFKQELEPRTLGELLLEDKASRPNRHAVETLWTNNPKEVAEIAAKRIKVAPTPETLVYLNYRARPVVPRGGAYSAIGSAFVYSDVSWDDEKDDAVNRKWSDEFIASLAAFDKAAYINETELVRHPERAAHCYSAEGWKRLQQVIERYDPQGLFVGAGPV